MVNVCVPKKHPFELVIGMVGLAAGVLTLYSHIKRYQVTGSFLSVSTGAPVSGVATFNSGAVIGFLLILIGGIVAYRSGLLKDVKKKIFGN